LEMIENGAGNRANVDACRPQVFLQMANPQAVDQIGQAIDRQYPGEQEMPMPRIGQVLKIGNGQPAWPAARLEFAIDLRPAQSTGGVELPRAYLGKTARTCGRIHRAQREESVIGFGTRHAPVKPWMGIEDV